jgi:hypothetical protein
MRNRAIWVLLQYIIEVPHCFAVLEGMQRRYTSLEF